MLELYYYWKYVESAILEWSKKDTSSYRGNAYKHFENNKVCALNVLTEFMDYYYTPVLQIFLSKALASSS